MKTALVLGGKGFIGRHMVNRLANMGYWVRSVDIEGTKYGFDSAHDFIQGDLTDSKVVDRAISLHNPGMYFDEVYQFAADMGGAGYIFTGEHDADLMHNSAKINLNVLHALAHNSPKSKIFYSSSACMYPAYNQTDPDNPKCSEDSAYPAEPDSEYGWEKLFSERLYLAYARNYGLNVRIARYHNIYGPHGAYKGGREKAPAAVCRKILEWMKNQERKKNFMMATGSTFANRGEVFAALNPDKIEIWGDGKQTRSFLYIDDCIDATRRLMESNYRKPINIGSEEMVTIQQLYDIVAKIAGVTPTYAYNMDKPQGVRGRNSDNRIISEFLGWSPKYTLEDGLKKTYEYIKNDMNGKSLWSNFE